MKRKWTRLMSTVLCLTMLAAPLPTRSEDLEAAVESIVDEVNVSESESIGEVPAPETPAPTQTPTEEPTQIPAEEPLPTEETVPSEEAVPSEEPIPTGEATPSAQPDGVIDETSIPEESVSPSPSEDTFDSNIIEATPDPDPQVLTETFAQRWIESLDAASQPDEYHRALLIYDSMLYNFAPGSASDALSALTQRSASSVGYALAFGALMHALDIECLTLRDGEYAWNLVKLDGAWTHIDVFADDQSERYGTHFGLTDAAMAPEHRWGDPLVELPIADDVHNNYFVRERGYAAFNGRDELCALLSSAIDGREQEVLLYCAGSALDIGSVWAELDTGIDAEITEDHCYASVHLNWPEVEPSQAPTQTDETLADVEDPSVVDEGDTPRGLQPSVIVPSITSLSLGVGESASIAGWTLLPAGTQGKVTYKSGATNVATVNAEGKVIGKNAGSATLELALSECPDVNCTVDVTVKKAPTSVSISADRTLLGVGETMRLGYTLSPGSVGSVEFNVPDDQNVGFVTQDGQFVALEPGKVAVTAKTYNGKEKSVTIEVKPAPTAMELTKESLCIGVGDRWTLGYSLNEGAAGQVSFRSEQPHIAEVDPASGEITATGIGETNIVVSAYNNVQSTLHVKVIAAPDAVELSAPRASIGISEKLQLHTNILYSDASFMGDVCALEYKTSSNGIATVNAEGVVTGKKAGTATITVTAYSHSEELPVKATLNVTVKKAPTSIAMKSDRTVLGVGEQLQVTYKLSSGSAGAAVFSIPEEQQHIATVTPDGLITAHEPGKFTLNAKTYNGKSAKAMKLTVKPAPTMVTLDQQDISLGLNDTLTLTASIDKDSAGKVTFRSDAPDVAQVDPDSGIVTAMGIGEAYITASAYGVAEARARVRVVTAPTEVILDAAQDTIGVSEKLQLDAILRSGELPFAGSYCTLTYSSNKSKVAAVSADGVVTGKEPGTATITVTTYDKSVSGTFKVTVKKAPSSVNISAERTLLGAFETMQLGYSLPSGSAGLVTFKVPEDQNVGMVSSDGLFTALNPGQVTVTATTYNGKKKSVTIEVRRSPSGITITDAPETLGVGASAQLVAEMSDPESAGKLYYRVVDGEAFASIDENGLITAIFPGTATFEVYTYMLGVTSRTTVDLLPAPETLDLPIKSINLGVGDSYAIEPIIDDYSAANFSYASSSKANASVSADGVVKGVKVGKSTITVKTHNGLSAKFTVNVKAKPTSIKAKPASIELGVGARATLGATLSANSASTLRFECDDEQIASVEPDGTITALAEGETTVTITTHNGLSATCAVTVAPAPETITIDVPDVLSVGQKVSLDCKLFPENACAAPEWEIVSGDCVTIKNGKLNAKKEGTAVLRVTTYLDDVSDELEILVAPAPQSISFDQDEYVVMLGETLQLEPTLEPAGSAGGLTFAIKSPGVFEIDETGLVLPIQRGKSSVTVKTYNGHSTKITIKVWDHDFPEAVEFAEAPPTSLDKGQIYMPVLSVMPESADPDMSWTSSSDAVVHVDPDTGEIQAISAGLATIKGTSGRNAKLSLSYTVIVNSDDRCVVMPSTYRVTSADEVDAIFAQIDAVRDSAYDELEELYTSGIISQSEQKTRKGYIKRAFEMYRHAWTPNAKMPYWKAANSNGGAKDFTTKYIYIGIPYTQTNRLSYPSKAIDDGYYKNSGDGYYVMQTKKFDSRMYPGSDCSSFCSMAVWGYSSSRRSDSTRSIASASYYKTPSAPKGKSAWQDLRPGDLICSGGHHTVMFLYYVNDAKTQFAVIEQGGEPFKNCNVVCASIRDQSYYKSRGYKIRRVSSLNMTWQDRVAK